MLAFLSIHELFGSILAQCITLGIDDVSIAELTFTASSLCCMTVTSVGEFVSLRGQHLVELSALAEEQPKEADALASLIQTETSRLNMVRARMSMSISSRLGSPWMHGTACLYCTWTKTHRLGCVRWLIKVTSVAMPSGTCLRTFQRRQWWPPRHQQWLQRSTGSPTTSTSSLPVVSSL